MVHEKIKFSCHHCPKAYCSIQGLKSHIAKHIGNRAFECNHCEKKYFGKRHLDEHVKKKHSRNSPKKQPIVLLKRLSKKMIDSYDLKLPKEMAKPRIRLERLSTQTIEMWKRSNHFNSNANLETNSNPTELCDSCGEMFNTKESLDNHMKLDHDDAKEKEELCDSCGQMFESVEALANHVNINHSISDIPAVQAKGPKSDTKMKTLVQEDIKIK